MSVGIIITSDTNPLAELLPIDNFKSSIDAHLTGLSYVGAEINVVCLPNQIQHFANKFARKSYKDAGIYPKLTVIEGTMQERIRIALEQLGSPAGYTFIGKAETIIPPDTYSRFVHENDGSGIMCARHDLFMGYPLAIRSEAYNEIHKAEDFVRQISRVHGMRIIDIPYYYNIETFRAYVDYLRKVQV